MAKQQTQNNIASADTLDLRGCSPEERERIERSLNRRDTVFSLHFRENDVKEWKKAAKRRKEILTDWVERNLNIATTSKTIETAPPISKIDLSSLDPIRRKRVEKELRHRGKVFSLRLRRRDIDSWKVVAEALDESLTDWVERSLNAAVISEGKK